MVFTDAHSNSAVCTPTRYGVLTGRYCWRSRLKQGVLFGYSRELIEHDRLTVPAFLRSSGYRTACIGKWHLGLGWRMKDGGLVPPEHVGLSDPGVDYSRTPAYGPHTAGFDYSFILPSSLDMPPYCYLENGHVLDAPGDVCAASARPAFWREGAIAPGVEHETSLLEFTRRAETFIADHAREAPETPFFLYWAPPSPHTPHVPRPPFRGKSACGAYGDYVAEHDWSIAQLLKALDRNGLRENTLVIVTSDNGAHMRGNGFDIEREYGHRSNHIYRGQKADVWDGGHRVPFLARWPGIIPTGSRCSELVCLTDLLATCAELTGHELPEGSGEDSISFLPLLKGEKPPGGRKSLVHSSFYGHKSIRHGDWKLIDSPDGGGFSTASKTVSKTASKTVDSSGDRQLYHMKSDPSETRNLYASEPKCGRELLDQLLKIQSRP
ncbi:MAG: arylsulfatase [Verrucomicrobia bacterium]|nr:arylsulfatase [Verrucomicrobiota bacterium]MCH8526961.1 arylsulfatase [Kiritimatiellia bacterium]